MERIVLIVTELEEALKQDILDDYLWQEVVPRYGGNEAFCNELLAKVTIEVKKVVARWKENPDTRPSWAGLLVVSVDPPKAGKVSGCFWEQRIEV